MKLIVLVMFDNKFEVEEIILDVIEYCFMIFEDKIVCRYNNGLCCSSD